MHYTEALKQLENGKASIIATIEPVVASVLGVILYKEIISLGEGAGMLCIMGAIILCNL